MMANSQCVRRNFIAAAYQRGRPGGEVKPSGDQFCCDVPRLALFGYEKLDPQSIHLGAALEKFACLSRSERLNGDMPMSEPEKVTQREKQTRRMREDDQDPLRRHA